MPTSQPKTIRMVAGLGNPGEEYANTRHNAGFRAIDELGRRLGAGYWKASAARRLPPSGPAASTRRATRACVRWCSPSPRAT